MCVTKSVWDLLCHVLRVLCFIKAVAGHSVNVQLQYVVPPTTYDCIGGNVGLTNTSILLQYQPVVQEDALNSSSPAVAATQGDWTDLAATAPLDISTQSQVSVTFSLDSSVDGVQFRLLQLEHGGGSCNCWALDSMNVTLDNQAQMSPLGAGDVCVMTGEPGLWTFCDGGAGEARGSITRVFYFPGRNGSTCASNISTLLSDLGPSLPANCSMVTPRL